MSKWFLESIEINGGFLPGFSLKLPRGLTCIIGRRGSGKSTLTEALRCGVGGSVGATKARLELIQANLGSNTLITIQTASDSSGTGYTIRRTYKQSASLITADGKSITTVDLDRGTFLPLDGYSSAEIEGIADESIGEKRRSLLDELRGEQLRAVHIRVAEHRRALDANADKVRSTERLIADLTEQVEEMGDVRARLVALPRSVNSDDSAALATSTRQCQINQREIRNLTAAAQSIARYRSDLRQLAEKYQNNRPENLTVDISANIKLLLAVQESLASAFDTADVYIGHADDELAPAQTSPAENRNNLAAAHAGQG